MVEAGLGDTFGQSDADVRFEWGPTAAPRLAPEARCLVVVDVLSFTTAVSICVSRGMTVFPHRWGLDAAEAFAAAPRRRAGRAPSRSGAPSSLGRQAAACRGRRPPRWGCSRPPRTSKPPSGRAAPPTSSSTPATAPTSTWPPGSTPTHRSRLSTTERSLPHRSIIGALARRSGPAHWPGSLSPAHWF